MRGDIESILAALNKAEIRYLIVGGVAVVLHGHLRATNDLDLVIQLKHDNLLEALQVLDHLGFQPLVPVGIQDFVEPQNRKKWIQEKNMVVFSLWHPSKPTQKIDLFVEEPFDFEAVYERSASKTLGTTEAPVVSLDDLIEMKRAAGRPQDLADVETLRILKTRSEGRSV
jgi:hypothetical protein